MKKRDIIFGLIIGVTGLVLAVGARTFAHPCVHADGSAAMCAPTETWLTVAGGLIAILAGIAMIRPKTVLQAAITLACIPVILIPGTLAPICSGSMMRCRTVTQPFALVTGILIILVSAGWLALSIAETRREKRL